MGSTPMLFAFVMFAVPYAAFVVFVGGKHRNIVSFCARFVQKHKVTKNTPPTTTTSSDLSKEPEVHHAKGLHDQLVAPKLFWKHRLKLTKPSFLIRTRLFFKT